jgi:hypothetical protein
LITNNQQKPWASGPGEILKHGLTLLKDDSDTNRRLAMIMIDNAVELMMKTYLGLPHRITGLRISRNEQTQFMENFPELLDAMERHAGDKLKGINLGDIEWYHRLRNQLYHQGNGLTVERNKVEVYSELANVIFTNLFGFRLVEPESDETVLLREFMQAWANFERVLSEAVAALIVDSSVRPTAPMQIAMTLLGRGYISGAELAEMIDFRDTRDEMVLGEVNFKDKIKPEMVKRLVSMTSELQKRVQSGHLVKKKSSS